MVKCNNFDVYTVSKFYVTTQVAPRSFAVLTTRKFDVDICDDFFRETGAILQETGDEILLEDNTGGALLREDA